MTKECFHLQEEFVGTSFDELEDGFAIDGCCGGGCYTIQNIKFCPFCGKEIFPSLKGGVVLDRGEHQKK